MRRLFTTMLTVAAVASSAWATPSQGYGIRVYSNSIPERQAIVSFPVDNPTEVTEVYDLTGHTIVAAAAHDGVYYMFESEDGLTCQRFLTYDLTTNKLNVVKEYDWKFDDAANIIYTDATFDPSTGMVYAAGYNMNEGDIIDGQPTAPFGIFTVDPSTGTATLVGMQDYHALVAIAADEWGLKGVDENGTLWEVSKYSGNLDYQLIDSNITPYGLQSMSYDFGKQAYYWASFTADANYTPTSDLVKFTSVDYEYGMASNGAVGDMCELIGLYIDSDPLPTGAPSVISDLTVTPAANGVNNATLSWVNPTKTIGGDVLGSFKINIYRGDVLATTIDATAGEVQSWTDTNVETGLYAYHVAAVNDVCEGKAVYADALWIGIDTPGAPSNIKAVKSPSSYAITLTWEAPVTGAHGGWFDASQLKYTVVRYPDNKTVVENSTAMSLVDEDIVEAHGYYYVVTASTAAGEGTQGRSNTVASGEPHTVPYLPDFNKSDDAAQWTIFNLDNDIYTWYTDSNWAGTYDTFFRFYPELYVNPEEGVNDWLVSPAVALEEGKLYVAQYDVRLLGALFPANTLLAMGTEADPAAMSIVLEQLDHSINDIEWITHSLPFTVDKSGTYYFGYQVSNSVPVQFYKFKVIEVEEVDMAATEIHGSTMGNLNTPSEYTVMVTNLGYNTVDDYTVELLDGNGDVVAESNFTTPIASQASAEVSVEWTPSATGTITLTPRVKVAGDANADNDMGTSITVSVMGEGKFIDLYVEPLSATPSAPFYGYYNNSAVQTIYDSELLNLKKGTEIKAAIYYISNVMGMASGTVDFDVQYGLACTDKADFSDSQMLSADEFTTVYDNVLPLDMSAKTVAIIFDKPFVYDGGNLCVFTRHSSEKLAYINYVGSRPTADSPYWSCIYNSSSEPFDFTQTAKGARELPKVSLLIDDLGGVENIAGDVVATSVNYDRASRTLFIGGDYTVCNVYAVSGALLGSYSGSNAVNVANLPTGLAIVEVISAEGRTVAKVVL